jgi:hypothetical protein
MNDYSEWDIAGALFYWLQHHWNGQSDEKYSDYCTLTAPGMYSRGGEGEMTEEEQIIYDELTDDNYKEYLSKVLNYKSED